MSRLVLRWNGSWEALSECVARWPWSPDGGEKLTQPQSFLFRTHLIRVGNSRRKVIYHALHRTTRAREQEGMNDR